MLRDQLAVDTVVWLPDGLYNDETDGHVDNFCCYVRPGEVLLAWTDDSNDPNYARCHAAMEVLKNTRDAKGREFIVHKMPIPGRCLPPLKSVPVSIRWPAARSETRRCALPVRT